METPPIRKYKKHKQGYTVSATYYLRNESNLSLSIIQNGIMYDIKREPILTLYIRVSFLGQTVKIRSRLMGSMAESHFEEYMAHPDVKEFVKNETAAIKHSVNEMKPDQIIDFRISQWSTYYNDSNESIFDCAQKVIMERLRQVIRAEYDVSKFPKALQMATGGIEGLPFLAQLEVKPAVALFNKFKPIFDLLSSEDSLLRGPHDGRPVYSLWDWKLGNYQLVVTKKYSTASTSILPLLNELLSEYVQKQKVK